MTLPLRALAAALLVSLSGSASAAPCAGFTDVDTSSSFCTSVEWMKNRGITLGCTATQYCPNDYVTRLQMAAFIYRLGFQNTFLNGGNAFGATAVLGTTDNQMLDVVVNGQRAVRLQQRDSATYGTGLVNHVGGHATNVASRNCTTPIQCAIGENVAGATIGGGGASVVPNVVTDTFGTIGGGIGNVVGDNDSDALDARGATVAGGVGNSATALYSTVAGGTGNDATAANAAVGGGLVNVASGVSAFIGGGEGNIATGFAASVLGGASNQAGGDYSVALGRRARTLADGSFAFADSSPFDFTVSTAIPNRFFVRATGGILLVVEINGSGLITTSCALNAAGGAWSCTSDRAQKTNLVDLDGRDVLERLVAMPVYRWNPRNGTAVDHIGPTAQDFRAAFGLGDSELRIASQDADGVALAAIKGLDAKLRDEVASLRERNAQLERSSRTQQATLEARIAALEAALRASRADAPQ